MSATCKRCAIVIGAGVIGAGWAARFVLNGLDVVGPRSASRSGAARPSDAWRMHARARAAHPGALGAHRRASLCRDASPKPSRQADFIQESAPEREELKRDLLREIDAHAPPDALIASSTSGLLPTRLQAEMSRPERFLVGHPFNPVYLLPLVELCGGEATAPASIDRAAGLLRRARHASAAPPQGDRRLHCRPPARGAVARGAVARP